MKIRNITLLTILSLLVIFGCSKKREEAAQLEQELMGQADSALIEDTLTQVVDTTLEMDATDAEAVPEEEAIVTPPMPGQPVGDGFTVQVASCEDEAYSRYLVDIYIKRGYEPYVTQISIEGQVYHRVRVGMFDSITEARLLEAKLEDAYSINAWIDQVAK